MAGAADFDAFMADHSAALLRYAYLLTGDAAKAQDLTQETLARVYEARRRVEPEGLGAYARRVMHNQSVSWWRKITSREASLPDEVLLPARPDTSTEHADRQELLAAVRALPVKARSAIVLYYYEDYSTAQIADVLDTSETAVRALLSRGRAALRKILDGNRQEAML